MIKNIILFFYILVLFSGCFEEEKTKKKVVQKQTNPTEYLVQKVKDTKEENKTLVDTIQDDGIVIDGARDERLLEAFDRAVAQVIVEEGVSVPECDSLSKTEYLTLKECQEITEKYFGFYEIDFETGEAKKVEDVFAQGIVGESVELRDSELELFDSSGNPLLDNLVEFEEMVDNSSDLLKLKKISQKIPAVKKRFKEKIDERIKFLEDVEEEQSKNTRQQYDNEVQEKNNNEQNNNQQVSNNQNSDNNEENDKQDCNSILSSLDRFYTQKRKLEKKYEADPYNEKTIDSLTSIEIEIANLEALGCN